VTECWQVEIDERVTRLAERHFPGLTVANGDPRAHLHFGDGLGWIRDAAPASLDVVIVDSTDPVGPAEGLFGEKFYRDCHRALGGGGLVVQQSESPILNTALIVAMHRALRAAGFDDVRTLTFPQPIYPSGWWSATLARKGARIEGLREHDAARLEGLRYYTPAIHRAAFALPAFLEKALAKV
jgi:spermidine synthase